MFDKVVAAYQAQENSDNTLICQADHVDGGMNASQKEEKLNWLKADSPDNTCRILSNVRCLSEGVDVPALDAVLFLTPRNSQVDVVQSVGRVMRNAPGKKRGYVILPVVIPVGMEPHEALNDNKVYKVVWQVLQALRSHDDTFDAMINKIDLTGHDTRKMEVIAITDKAQKKSTSSKDSSGKSSGKGGDSIGTASDVVTPPGPDRSPIPGRRTGTRPLRQGRQKMWQSQPLGGMGRRHRQDRQDPHLPHHPDRETRRRRGSRRLACINSKE